jgi:hypothetical protein
MQLSFRRTVFDASIMPVPHGDAGLAVFVKSPAFERLAMS